MKKKKGFTLLELLIVIVVLAVLAGLALPQYLKTVGRAKEAEGWSGMAAIRGSIFRFYADGEALPTTFADLDIDDPNVPVPRNFDYSFTSVGPLPGFDVSADPLVSGARSLTLSDTGARTSTP